MKSFERNQTLLKFIESSSTDLYENAPCGFIFTLPDGNFLKVNQTFRSWIGYSDSELLQLRFQNVLTVGCRIYYETNYSPLLHIQGFLREITLDLLSREKKSIPVLINSEEIKDKKGIVILIRSTLFNISERRKYERDLISARKKAEQSEQRFRFLAKAGELLRSSLDYNNTFKVLMELAIQDICDACSIDLWSGKNISRIGDANQNPNQEVPQLCLEESSLLILAPILIKDFVHNLESNLLEKSIDPCVLFHKSVLELMPESAIMVPILKKNQVIGVLALYITELGRKFSEEDLELGIEIARRASLALETAQLQEEKERTSEALVESHELFSTTLQSIGDAVIAVNTDRTVSFINPMAESLTGWTLSEARGKPISVVFQIIDENTEKPSNSLVERVLKGGIIVSCANYSALIRKDGSTIMIEDNAAPIRNSRNQINGVVLIFRDITMRHNEEQERQLTLLNLQEEKEVREKFVATLTHDLRTPITSVKMSAQMILRKTDNQEFIKVHASKIVKGVSRLDQMIQDLLDANRVRAGEKITLQLDFCDLNTEVKEALIDLATIHGNRFIFESSGSIQGYWNSASLRRIVENLCNNAVKYGETDVPIRVTLSQTESEGILKVHNQGSPISKEDQRTLFEPYRRTSSAQVGAQKGWGLGLTLVRGVAEAHGGKVSVESLEEEGTTFTVVLPLNPVLESL